MDNKKPNITALIVAAGQGERFGGSLPKQYLPLLGRPVYMWSVEAFRNHPAIADVRVVIHPDHAALSGIENPILGGATRQESVLKGLEAIVASNPDYVLIHDAARPGITAELISGIVAGLQGKEAVVPGLPVADTLRRVVDGATKTENRDNLFAIQTPQAFKFKTIFELHQKNKGQSFTDDAALCEATGIPVAIVAGDKGNFKLTVPDDFAVMEQTLSFRCGDLRTGQGYDVHRLVPPANELHKLKLCGIAVPHDKVLEGHSDADVALHAITDALLAAICDGDIGMHFSPKDARWKNADSSKFLKHAGELIAAQGGLITHVDVTIICEAPKIGPYREKMRESIAGILSLPVTRVSVKATTTEGLGFTGRGEGIAAEAVATVRLPFARTQGATPDDIRKWGT